MRPERHYDDEALVTMFASGAGASDAHLAACAECSDKLDSFRLVTDALHDAATWDKREISEAPNPATIASLRSFADTMAAEDSAADAFLADLLAGSRETWATTLAAHPEYRTPGTVRRLIAATDKALDTMPADAVEITGLAVSIAEGLDASAHRATTVATFRGQAWRERAYALFYTGQFAEAEKAVTVAERCFEACVVDEYELARVGIVRALVERMFERHSNGATAAQTSAASFSHFGDSVRHAAATIAEAQMQMAVSDFKAAYRALTSLERDLRDTPDGATHARVLANLGTCCFKMGRLDESIRHLGAASDILEHLDIRGEALRVQWNIASILASAGRMSEAQNRFNAIQAGFLAIGMTSAAALVSLDLAEILIAERRYEDAEAICNQALMSFEAAGVAQTTRARVALAYLTEATRNRAVTELILREAREYIRHPGRDTGVLLFAQPPA